MGMVKIDDLMRTLTLTLPSLNPSASRDSRVDVVSVCCDPTRPLHPQSNRAWQHKMSQGTKQADKPRRFRRGTRLFARPPPAPHASPTSTER